MISRLVGRERDEVFEKTVASMAVPALVAVPLGALVLRLRGTYFVLVTFVLSEIMQLLLFVTPGLTGGSNGIAGIPVVTFFGIELADNEGVLLLTAPGITPIDKGEWKETWYWTFTDKALHRLLAETFPGGNVEIASFGNVRVATSYLYGMGLLEVPEELLAHYDPQFQVINTVKAVKHATLA